MDYKSATNPDTGDKVFLVDNKWVKPSKSATNPDTGDKAYLINNKWHEVAAPADTKENAPQASMRDESNQPDAKKGNWFTDITAGLAIGAGDALSAPTNISDILAGKKPYEAKGTPEALAKTAGMPLNAEDAYKGILNALTPGKISSLEDIHTKLSGLAGNVLQPKAAQELGGELLAAGESTKSTELKELERQRSENISKETSLLGEGKAAMGYTLANPSMLPNFIAEQIPNLVLPIGAGKLAIGTAKSLFTAATEKTLSRIGVSAAVATGAAQQAGDTGGDTYEAVHSHLIAQGMPEEEAHKIAIEKAKVAAGKAAAISIATGFIPGANALERQLIGKAETEIAKKGIAKYVSTGLNVAGEATQEGIEEGGGKYVSNVGLQQVAPETNVMKGVGGAAGLGALGGGIFGGLTHIGGHTPTTGAATTADAKWEFDENGNLVPKKAETQVAPTGQAAQVLPPEQLNLDLQGGNAPTPKTPFQLAGGPGKYEAMAAAKNVVDPQKILELRNQYDTLEQELNRLQKTFETETDPAKQEAIKVQAQKLDFARQEVESQLKAIKNIPPRTAAQGTQRTLDLEPHTPPPIATNAQESLFAPEEIPPKIDQSVLNESEKKASEIERNIFALQQGPQTTKTKNQIAALQSQLETEQANIEKIDAQEEMKLVVPKPISPIVGNVMSKFGIAPKAPIRNEIKNLDMTDPEDRAAFVAAVNKHTMKHAKINMEEVEKYLNNFEGKPNERATAGGEGVSGDVTGGPESSNAMPVQETAAPQGTALSIAGGMGSNIGDTGGVTGGEEVPSTTQQGTLGAPTQAPTAIPPIPAPPVTQQATTQPTSVEEPQAPQNYGSLYNVNTPSVLQQPNVTMGAIPTSNVIEGEATVSPKQVEVQNDAVHDELTSKEQTQLAVLYGQDTYNDVAKARFIDDFIKAVNEGFDKVHKIVANIVRRLQATVLATAIIMNPNYMSPASIVLMPIQQQVTTTEQVRAEVPKEVKGMSDGAKKAYSILMPALKDQGKYFTIIDKPSATAYVFNSDGSLVKQSKVLLGKTFGDFYKGGTDFVQNRITPAGDFIVSAEKGGTTYDGKTIYTVGNVDEGWSAAIFHTVYTKESDAKARLAALDKEGPEDSRYSHGCINGSPDLMESINNGKMDKSHMFVVPDNPELLDSFIANTVPNTDLTRETVTPKTVTKTTTERGQGVSTTGGEDQFAIRREDSKTAALEELKKQKRKPRNVTPSELTQAKELFGEYGNDSIALLRSGFTLADIARALGIIKNNLPTSEKINEWEQAYEEAGGKKSMPNVGRVEKTINQIKNLKKSYDSNEDVSGTFLKALTDITSTANLFSFDRGYSNRIRAAMIALKDKGDITLDQFKQGLLRTSISQALHRKDLARKFLSMGDLIYSKATNRWSAVNDEINWGNFESLVKKFATDIGGTPEQALKYMGKAYEANRVLDDYKLMDKLAKDVNDTRAEVDVLSKNKSRNAAEERALNKKRDLLKEFTKQYQHQVDLVQHMTRAQAQAGVKNMLDMHPAIKQGMDIINTIKQRAVKIMVDTGVINEDAAKDWINDLSYVPFSREIDDAKNGGAILSRNLKEVMKERHKEGSMREVKNTIENMYDWYQWAISRAISNQQMNVMVDQYKAVLPDEVKKGRGQRGNTFSVWKNGMEEFYNVSDPTIAQAFLGMESMVFPGIGVWMQFKNAFSHLVTRMPAFPLVQLFSDTYDAMTTSGLRHPFGLLKEVGKEIVKTAKGTSEARRIMSAAGVLMTHDANALTSADDLTKKMNLDDPSAYRKTMNALDKWAAVNDNIVRQAVYSQGIKENLSHSMAMEKAVELVNFRRISGNPAIVFASKVIPFFGAYMQVTDVALKTITGKGITPQERKEGLKIFVATTAKLAALTFLYSAAVGDDDDYKNKTRISRDQSFVIPGTGGLSIPVRPGFFSINKLIGEYGYKYLAENSTDAPEEFVKAMSRAVLKQFSPPSTTLVTPALGLYLNKDIYNNRDIANPTMRKLLPEDQYNKYTSEMSKVLAEATGISALKIDYFLTSYFSSVASLTALATNALIADIRGVPLPTMSTRDKIASLPNVSKFISKEETSDAIADFYDTTKDISTLVDTLNSLGQYSPEKAQKLMEKPENIKLLKGADKTENAKAVLAKLNAEERYIREQPENKMSGDKKAEKLKELNAYREKIREVTKQIKQSIE